MANVDVVVAGGGNAALCAAISARRCGASVVLFERAPQAFRGGNTRHTRDIRFAHYGPNRAATETYSEEELLDDLLRVTGGRTNRTLAELAIRESLSFVDWMTEQGIRWQHALKGTLHLTRTNGFFLGGGKHLVNTYYDTAIRLGVNVLYGATLRAITTDGRTVHGVVYEVDGREESLSCRALVVAAGGFEADVSWLKEYWGEVAERFRVRGTPYNTGIALKAMYAIGSKRIGDPRGLHCVACDARSPKFDGGIITRVDAIPFGIVVNATGRRFYDEGEDLWPKRYAIWGKLVADQPGQSAYAIIDSKVIGRYIPSVYRPLRAESISELAGLLELDAAAVEATIAEFNAHIAPGGTFQPGVLDDCATADLTPAKSHWAVPIDTPPFYGYPLQPGVTFTYLGVEVDGRARVLDESGAPFDNLFAAGECMSGNILSQGYLAGFGLTIGTAFGRIAGAEAAQHVRY